MKTVQSVTRIRWMICLILAVITLAVYWPVWQFNFVNFDDEDYVVKNTHVQAGFTAKTLAWAFTTGHSSNWHPLTWLSHMLDFQFFGLNPGGHHFTNLLFHAATVLLVFLVFVRLTGQTWPSALVAALFAWHPTHVESVAWVSERKDVLSAFFWFLTLFAYTRYAQQQKRIAYFGALLFFALGLMAKPMLVTLPFVFLLLDYWPLQRMDLKPFWRRLIIEKLPFLALALLSSILTFVAQHSGGAVSSLDKLSPGPRLANAFVSYMRYLGKIFWPENLAVMYPHPGVWPWAWIASAMIVVAGVTLGVVLLRQKHPFLPVGWFWFIGTLVPVIGLVQVGAQSMADRYIYIPSIGIFIMLAWGANVCIQHWPTLKGVFGSLGGAALAGCLLLTWQQEHYWKNSETLFRHALAVTTDNFVAHTALGVYLSDHDRKAEAMAQLQAAAKIDPAFMETRIALARELTDQGKLDEAAAEYVDVLKNQPENMGAHNNFGYVLMKQGKLDEALAHYAKALEIDPDSVPVHNNLGELLTMNGKFDEASSHFQRAVQGQPANAEIHQRLGLALASIGKTAEAIDELRLSLRLKPHNADAHYNLGVLLKQSGNLPEAETNFSIAQQLQPGLAAKYKRSGEEFAAAGNLNGAVSSFTAVTYLQPNDTDALTGLGLALAQLGQIPEAIKYFKKTVSLIPNDYKAHRNLGLALLIQGDPQEAILSYREALRLKADAADILNDLAWILATHSKAEIRHGAEAVQLAERACQLTQSREPRFLGTLDAAYAEAGHFLEAIVTAEKTRALALAAGQKDTAEAAGKRLELYHSRQAYRQ